MAKRRGAGEQQREVAGWKASGLSAAQYAARRGYTKTSLFRWARQCSVLESTVGAPQFVRLEVALESSTRAEIVVQVGPARLVVARGFDAELLGAVVDAIDGRSRK